MYPHLLIIEFSWRRSGTEVDEGMPVYRYGGQYWPAKQKQGRAWTKSSKIFQLK
jgi:hypothetical protein